MLLTENIITLYTSKGETCKNEIDFFLPKR